MNEYDFDSRIDPPNGIQKINSQGEVDLDYVKWLEEEVIRLGFQIEYDRGEMEGML